MTRRRRPRTWCPCGEPARKGDGTKLCARCYARAGRPKATCRVCLQELAADRLVGRRCRPCVSEAAHGKRIVETYGITSAQYRELLAHQDGVCYVCQRKPGAKRLAVDHDHTSGAVRGLLCRGCNRDVLGHLRENVPALLRAVSYLTYPPAERLWPDRGVTRQQGTQ